MTSFKEIEWENNPLKDLILSMIIRRRTLMEDIKMSRALHEMDNCQPSVAAMHIESLQIYALCVAAMHI